MTKQPVPGLHENFAEEAAMSTDKAMVTPEMIEAVAYSASSQPGQPFGMILTDEDIRNILTIGLANAPAALVRPGNAMVTDCDCTKVEQDETCPFGYPSLLCEACDGKGVVPAALAQAEQPVAVKQSGRILAILDGQPMNGPVSYHHEEGGFVEFINEDRPYFVRDLNAPAAILVDMETRKVIGYRVYDPDAHPPAKREAGETAAPVTQLEGGRINAKTIARLAYGYELMFQALSHIGGTSGGSPQWYTNKGREVLGRIDPLWKLTDESNAHKPGDCLSQYRPFANWAAEVEALRLQPNLVRSCIRCGGVEEMPEEGITCAICIEAIRSGSEPNGADRSQSPQTTERVPDTPSAAVEASHE